MHSLHFHVSQQGIHVMHIWQHGLLQKWHRSFCPFVTFLHLKHILQRIQCGGATGGGDHDDEDADAELPCPWRNERSPFILLLCKYFSISSESCSGSEGTSGISSSFPVCRAQLAWNSLKHSSHIGHVNHSHALHISWNLVYFSQM